MGGTVNRPSSCGELDQGMGKVLDRPGKPKRVVRVNCQLVLVRGPEGPQGAVGVEEVREVTGGQSIKGLVCEE